MSGVEVKEDYKNQFLWQNWIINKVLIKVYKPSLSFSVVPKVQNVMLLLQTIRIRYYKEPEVF